MASRGKKKPTMAKLNREAKLRERRATKEASKQARQLQRDEPPVDVVVDPDDPSAPAPDLADLGDLPDPAELVAVESAPAEA